LRLNDIFRTYAFAVIPIGWAYGGEVDKVPVHPDMLLEGKYVGKPVNVFPCATAFVLSIDEERTLLVTANHAFPDLQRDKAEVCVIIPEYLKCPYEVSMDDFSAYPGAINYLRFPEQDICVFEVDTPEALYMQNPVPLPLSFGFEVGDEVCTIGYPFIGYEGRVTDGRRDIRFVERLTYAHLSAIWPDRGTLTLEFDNYVGPGNSGGPLINVRTGAAIGVVTWSRIEEKYHSVTTFSHATCIIELDRARDRFPDIPDIGHRPPFSKNEDDG
jgi:hypothetical protein